MASLLDSIMIQKLRIKNRIVMPPMATELASESGDVTEALVAYYRARCRSVGLVIVEHSFMDPIGRLSNRQLGIYSDRLISGLSKLAKAVHDEETVVAIQINHAGRKASSRICQAQPVAPSPVPDPESKEVPRELDVDEIESIVKKFGLASSRALKAGFDAVEIHGAHGFLLNQFCSPITNIRTDKYGGPLENRMRFSLEVASEVLKTVGKDVPILYRLGADDMKPGGLTIGEAQKIAQSLVNLGISVIDVSGGLCGSRPPNLSGEGYFAHLAEGIKQFVRVPVITAGGIKTPQFADAILRRGIADLVGVGRALVADPDWALKAVDALGKSSTT